MYYALKRQGMPPLGLGYLATALLQENYTVKILDMCLNSITVDSLIQILKDNKVRIVGFSCGTESYSLAVQLAKLVKQYDMDIVVVFGGPHVSFEYTDALKHDEIDYIVFYEGEVSFRNLCNHLLRGEGHVSEVKGIAYTESGNIKRTPSQPLVMDLDTLSFPDRRIFDNLTEYPIYATVSTSRGCPGRCIFCAAGTLSGRTYRMRSAKNIVREFEHLKELGCGHVVIVDDTMTVNAKRVNEFADELIQRDLKMTWQCESRVDNITKEILLKLKSSGLAAIQFGVESGSQTSLDCMKKGIDLEQVRNAFKWCHELGIYAYTNIIVGSPSDTHESICESLRVAEEIIELGGMVVTTICTPFPGTELWENPGVYGIEIVEKDLEMYTLHNPIFNTKHMNMGEIRNARYTLKQAIAKTYKRLYGDNPPQQTEGV